MTKMTVEGLPSIDELTAAAFGKDAGAASKPLETAADKAALLSEAADATVAEHNGEKAPIVDVEEVVEKPKAEEKRDPMAARFAAIARREREARAARAEAEKRSAELEERQRKLDERESQWNSVKDPIAALQARGFSYADATEMVLSGKHEAKPIDPVESKLKEGLSPLSSEVEELKKRQQVLDETVAELSRLRMENAQREVRQSIEKTAKEGGFEFVASIGDEAYILVQDVITEYYKKNKRVLNYEEACGRVEKYYEDRFEKLAAASKVQSRFASSTEKTATTQSKIPVAKEPPRTLTSSLSTSARAKVDLDKLSKHEAVEYLASRLQFK